jgi:hypothetical protein
MGNFNKKLPCCQEYLIVKIHFINVVPIVPRIVAGFPVSGIRLVDRGGERLL